MKNTNRREDKCTIMVSINNNKIEGSDENFILLLENRINQKKFNTEDIKISTLMP
jgi:hypothetical protein